MRTSPWPIRIDDLLFREAVGLRRVAATANADNTASGSASEWRRSGTLQA